METAETKELEVDELPRTEDRKIKSKKKKQIVKNGDENDDSSWITKNKKKKKSKSKSTKVSKSGKTRKSSSGNQSDEVESVDSCNAAPQRKKKTKKKKTKVRKNEDSEESHSCDGSDVNEKKTRAKSSNKTSKKASSTKEAKSYSSEEGDEESNALPVSEKKESTTTPNRKKTKKEENPVVREKYPYGWVEEEQNRLVFLHGSVKKLKKRGSLFAGLWVKRYFAAEMIVGFNELDDKVAMVRFGYFVDKVDFDHGLVAHMIDLRKIVKLIAFQDSKPKLQICCEDRKEGFVLKFKHIKDQNYWALGLAALTGKPLESISLSEMVWPTDCGDELKHYEEYLYKKEKE